MNNPVNLLPMVFPLLVVAACGSEPEGTSPDVAPQTSSEIAAPQANANARLTATPASIDLDPCSLMDDAALADLEINSIASIGRKAGVEQIFNTSTKAPYIDCDWTSPSGPPSMHIRVYHAPEVAKPNELATPVQVGDGGWLVDEDGRVRLYAKSGDRLVRLSPQAPKYYSADDATYLSAIFSKVAGLLTSPAPSQSKPGSLPAADDVCDALQDVPSSKAFGSDVVALPVSNRIFDDSTRGANWGNSSGCHWVELANNRYSVTARFLDETARDYIEKSNSGDWKDTEIGGHKARFARDTYLVDLGERGTLEVRGGLRVRDAMLEDAATNIVAALKS